MIFPALSTAYKMFFQGKSYAYDPGNYIWLLQEYYKNFRMRDLLKPTFVTTVDMTIGDPIILSSYQQYKDLFVWKAGRSTSAAPTYFPPANVVGDKGEVHEFVDGGVTTNNPTYLALRQLEKICGKPIISHGKKGEHGWEKCPNLKKINVVSIGTGYQKHAHDFESSSQGGVMGVIKIFTEVGALFASRLADRFSQEFLEGLPNHIAYNYYRFDPEFSDKIELDGVDEENLQKLTNLAKNIQCQPEFGELLRHLQISSNVNNNNNNNIIGNDQSRVVRLVGPLKGCSPQNQSPELEQNNNNIIDDESKTPPRRPDTPIRHQ